MDKERRNFLKIILIGSGTLLAGKVLGPLFSRRLDSSFTRTDPSDNINSLAKSSSSFKIVENDKVLSIYDNAGEEIFQIDKGA
ncbi:MAG: hypothetical protein M0P76_00465 [Candidatus Pacebacteria bacterium]|jgi:hypothetical protein|nr:hypothetical protein [Candidatus Paceibacterota bacterium]